MLGIDGVNKLGVPYPNIVVDHVLNAGKLQFGVAPFIAAIIKDHSIDIDDIGPMIDDGNIDIMEMKYTQYYKRISMSHYIKLKGIKLIDYHILISTHFMKDLCYM